MKEYYYAQAAKIENGVKYLYVPFIVTPDSELPEGKKPARVLIARRMLPCCFEWIPESYYDTHRRDLENQAKADERSCRCLVSDPNHVGGRIRCPEKNRCAYCPLALKFNFDPGHDTSLDALMDAGYDTESIDGENDFQEPMGATESPEKIFSNKESLEELNGILDSLIEMFHQANPTEGAVLELLRQGVDNFSEIARRCGLNPKHASEFIRRVQRKAYKRYIQMKK